MNIKITIDAPELASAIEKLATALGGMGASLPIPSVVSGSISQESVEDASKELEAQKEAAEKAKAAEDAKKKKAAEAKAKKEADAKAKKAAEEKAKAEAEEEETESEEQAISLEVVRGKLAELAAKGKEEQQLIQKSIQSFGVKKLTDVPEAKYAELLEACGIAI